MGNNGPGRGDAKSVYVCSRQGAHRCAVALGPALLLWSMWPSKLASCLPHPDSSVVPCRSDGFLRSALLIVVLLAVGLVALFFFSVVVASANQHASWSTSVKVSHDTLCKITVFRTRKPHGRVLKSTFENTSYRRSTYTYSPPVV